MSKKTNLELIQEIIEAISREFPILFLFKVQVNSMLRYLESEQIDRILRKIYLILKQKYK